MSIAEKLTIIAENEQKVYNKGFADGQASGGGGFDDEFWDNFQDRGKRTDYRYGFAGAGWTEDTYKPKYIVKPGPYASSGIFHFAGITAISNVDMSDVVNYASSWFSNCSNLKTIENLILPTALTNNFNSCFTNCTALENFSCVGEIKNNGFDIHFCTLLTHESLENIINALSETTTGLSITLPTTAQSNYQSHYGEGSWDILLANKENWTINYL